MTLGLCVVLSSWLFSLGAVEEVCAVPDVRYSSI